MLHSEQLLFIVLPQDPEHPRNLIPELCRQFYHLDWVTGTGGGISIKYGLVTFRVKPGFHMPGKSQTIGDLLFPDCPRFCRLMKTQNCRYPRLVGMDGDKSGESGAFLFSRHVSDFCDGQRSFPTNENSNLYRWGRQQWILLINNRQSPITHKHGISGTNLWRLSDISAKSGMVGKK